MRALVSLDSVLRLPVRMHGIQLGRPVDAVLDASEWRVVGLEVLCGDEAIRFLPWAASSVRDDEVAVASALILLEDVEFYRRRGRSFRALLDVPVEAAGAPLRDLLVRRDGSVSELVVDGDGDDGHAPVTPHPLAGEAA